MINTEHRTGRAILAGALSLGLLVGACSSPADAGPATTSTPEALPATTTTVEPAPVTVDTVAARPERGNMRATRDTDLTQQLATFPVADLTDEEIAGLLWMREEEKLAHDVYVTLYDLWGLQIFSNISEAETRHTTAVQQLLDRYDLDDPAAGNPVGTFTDPAIQALYDELVARGSVSIVDALTVGATIEDLDIVDLQERATGTPDIAMVYANLERGSRNHLRAFVRTLERYDASYSPSHLSQAAFDAIVSTPTERGSRG